MTYQEEMREREIRQYLIAHWRKSAGQGKPKNYFPEIKIQRIEKENQWTSVYYLLDNEPDVKNRLLPL